MSNQGVGLPAYPGTASGAPQPQTLYDNAKPQHQNTYTGQQPQPGIQHQQTTEGAPTVVQMVPIQPQMVAQPSTSMNTGAGVGTGVQNFQSALPHTSAYAMNVLTPGMVPAGPDYLMLCQQGQHAWTKRYGPCGIITALACFPCGLIALFRDVEEYCVRCGTRAPS